MKKSFIRRVAITLCGIMALAVFSPVHVIADRNDYRDYEALRDSLLDKVWNFNRQHPGFHLDSVTKNAMSNLSLDAPIGVASQLRPASKKKLSPEKIFDKCHRSSLIVGKSEHNKEMNQDRAYSMASAVALTSDGIIATNYHVVADLLLNAALKNTTGMETMRFATDWDGNIYPFESILYVDPINDMAIVKVSTVAGPLTPATIGDDLPRGAAVYCLSHTSGSVWNLTEGIVSNKVSKFDKRKGNTKYTLNISADYGVGASGGPIFDECGNLVALVSSTYSVYAQPQQYRNFQMAYKMTVPVFLIKELFP